MYGDVNSGMLSECMPLFTSLYMYARVSYSDGITARTYM